MLFPADSLSSIFFTLHGLTLQPSTRSQAFTEHLFCAKPRGKSQRRTKQIGRPAHSVGI